MNLGSVRSRLTPVARQTLKGSAAAVDLVRRPTPGITILIYHRVGAGSGGQMDLSAEAFDQQLEWLSQTQRVLSLDQALSELALAEVRPGAVPSPAGSGGRATADPTAGPTGVVLTFDDGTTDWVDHVLPSLERHGVPATFYVATSFIDEALPFPSDGRPMSWAGVAELASSDLVTIGSHTHRHLLLDRLPAADIADELDRSIDLLGSHTNQTVDHFAYPKAVAGSPEAETEVKARFRSAVLAGTTANHPGVDPYRLSRSPIQPSDGFRWFTRKATGGLGAEDEFRHALNRMRYRGLSS